MVEGTAMNVESDPGEARPPQSPDEPERQLDPDAPPGVIEFGDGSEVVYAGDWRAESGEDPPGVSEIVIAGAPIGQAVFRAATLASGSGGAFTVTLSTEAETTTFDDDDVTMLPPSGPDDDSLVVMPRDPGAARDLIPGDPEDESGPAVAPS
jgi:hypothetical protein